MAGESILVVEDNPITRKMMRFALESEGYRVAEAGEGEGAIRLSRDHAPALVLQDYVLPDMDGLSLLEVIRAQPGCGRIPIVIVTGMVSQIDELRDQADENTTLLPKPIEPSRLIEVVRGLLAGRTAAFGRGRRVLVVDDEPLNRKLAVLRLREAGFEVITAADGDEALAVARASPPDAIVSDVLMPGMDGFLLCREVRRDPQLAGIPVVLVSASYADEEDRRLAREVGADDLLIRTPDLAGVTEALKASLERREPRAGSPGVDVSSLHKRRLEIQLEKQLARNEALLRQGAIQAAALSVVRGLAGAVARPLELPSVLAEILVHCLDAAGLSTGLLYLVAGEGRLRLQAQAGVPSSAQGQAAAAFGLSDLLNRLITQREPVGWAPGRSEPAFAPLAEGLGHGSVLLVPFVVAEEELGILVLASQAHDLSELSWLGFARALAAQFGQTIAVAQSLSRGAASETRYRSLMEYANDAILLLDADYLILEANRQAESLLGRPREEIVGHRYEAFVFPDERQQVRDERSRLQTTGTLRVEERHLIRGDGGRVAVEISAAEVRVAAEPLVLFILRDIGARLRTERELRVVQERLQHVLASSPAVLYTLHHSEGTLQPSWVSPNIRELTGHSADLLGERWWTDHLHPEDREWVLAQTAELLVAGHAKREYRFRCADGTYRWIRDEQKLLRDAAGRPVEVVGSWWDVTDKRKLEAQLVQAQKMEAVGRLAGGVAHDFNNLLGIITGYAELLIRDLGAVHPGLRRAEEIRKAAERAASLTRQLLAFSRKQVLEPRILDLNAVVAEVERMLRRLIGEDIQLVTALGTALDPVRADPGQVEQVLLNLAVNARDAMPQGGKLILETANVEIDNLYCREHPDVHPGSYVMLAVSDTGHGIAPETMTHLFEPFFTTKGEGKGTGLGLATVFGIVAQSGGHIAVYSEVGQGSCFKVYLPRVDDGGRPALAPAPRAESSPTGNETMLLVEDAEPLGLVVREVLEEAGYRVLHASSPQAALALSSSHQGSIDAVLTDVVMPGMSGREMSERLLRERPGLRILFMSGYTDEAIGHHGVLAPGTHFLQKPFSTHALLCKLREVLDGPVPAG